MRNVVLMKDEMLDSELDAVVGGNYGDSKWEMPNHELLYDVNVRPEVEVFSSPLHRGTKHGTIVGVAMNIYFEHVVQYAVEYDDGSLSWVIADNINRRGPLPDFSNK